MKIAIVAAGFTPSEADKLRRAMATFKRVGTLHTFHDKMVEGMVARGYVANLPRDASSRSKVLAHTVFPKVTRPPSRCSSMLLHGSSASIRRYSPPR